MLFDTIMNLIHVIPIRLMRILDVNLSLQMYARRSRYSRSRSPYDRYSRSVSRSVSKSRSRSRSRSVENPGNNLYVTCLSPRITKKELEKHFSSEGGKVVDIHLVVDPRTRESRGFGFVTMSNVEEANRCLKYLDRSVLEGRVITVEKAKRRRGRTPTPGRYLGPRSAHVRRRSCSYSSRSRSRSRSPRYSSETDREISHSPDRRRYSRSRSPYNRSPDGRGERSYMAHSRNRSVTPYSGRHDQSYSPYYHRRRHDRSVTPYMRRHDRSYSPYRYRRRRDRSVSPYYRRRDRSVSASPSRGISASPRRGRHYRRGSLSPRSRRQYNSPYTSSSSRSVSLRGRRSSRRSYSRSASPILRKHRKSFSPSPRRGQSRSSRHYSPSASPPPRSRSGSLSSRSRSASSGSRSPTPV
ncbi:hypothetical protein C5167_047103 [Papaver somniferum]|uniref:RRM domain-containing protein n=2 Tax=Papaver somniferum TaxID=3469 RepID=A0A4Y7LGG0_PAPSO|nr:hypothetical protein C5167_047103 [Papaver somniferum]